MNEIEKILKDNMEDYESVKRQALKFIHENKKELSKNYAYAEVCGNPVDASHFFFHIAAKIRFLSPKFRRLSLLKKGGGGGV